MHLPVKAHYAAIAMLALAMRHEDQSPVSVREIADDHQVPMPFLMQILQQLKASELVISTRGASGGYRLRNSPRSISLAQIVKSVCPEGGSGLTETSEPLHRIVGHVWNDLDQRLEKQMECVLLSDLVERAKETRDSTMFYI